MKAVEISYPGSTDLSLVEPLSFRAKRYLGSIGHRMVESERALPPLQIVNRERERALENDDIAVVTQFRNAGRYLPSFLAHYRRLGVTRFLMVDDRSDDWGRSYAASQNDVDLFESPASYSEAGWGRDWQRALMLRHGVGRWYVCVDVDEYLVFDQHECRTLSTLIEALSAKRYRRLCAPMLDMYPVGNIGEANFDGTDGRMPWDVAAAFDAEGYFWKLKPTYRFLSGGVRQRVFNTAPSMLKFPLLWFEDCVHFDHSIHWPSPEVWNLVPIFGVLLHFKFFSDFVDVFRRSVEEGQHWNSAVRYRSILESVDEKDGFLSFEGAETWVFTGVDQLLQKGFLQSPW